MFNYRYIFTSVLLLMWSSATVTNALGRASASYNFTSGSPQDKYMTPGPRGSLLLPDDGKLVRSVGGMGILLVKYNKCEDDGDNEALTISIDVTLHPTADNDGPRITVQS